MLTGKLVVRCQSCLALFIGGWLIGIAGCGRAKFPPPVTFPVHGRLVVADGHPPLRTVVEFNPTEADLRAQGITDEAGKFSLFLISHSERYEGALEGPHQVKVIFPLGADRKAAGDVTLKETFVVESRENEFTINLP